MVRTLPVIEDYGTGAAYILRGEITDTGGTACDERGFDYRRQGEEAWTSWTERGEFGVGEFSYRLEGLQPGAVYAVKAKAHNKEAGEAGWSFGEILTFRVLGGPTVVPHRASDVTSSSAVLHGFLADDGGVPCTLIGFVYSKVGTGSGGFVEMSGSFTPPVVINDGFEDGTLGPFGTSGDALWKVDANEFYTASYSAKIEGVGDRQSGVLSLRVVMPSEGLVRFARKVSCDTGGDSLAFYIDQEIQDQWSGEVAWSEFVYPVMEGEHELRWVYGKDDSGAGGSDAAWVDDVHITCLVPYQLYAGSCLPNSLYEFRAYATNNYYWYWSGPAYFTTLPLPPTMVTRSPSDKSGSAARLNGEITDTGGGSCDQRGFDYRKVGETEWSEWVESGSFEAGTYSVYLDGLDPHSDYEYRAKARNAGGWGYGEVVQLKKPPTLRADPATGITDASATLHGYIEAISGNACYARSFRWRKLGQTWWQEAGSETGTFGVGPFSRELTGLQPGTTYEFYAEAINLGGTSVSQTVQFT
ncbi:MAG: fibronectin type III domain-containing protein, partial [Candidatus Geothermincolales bacterium]